MKSKNINLLIQEIKVLKVKVVLYLPIMKNLNKNIRIKKINLT
jgi:hypothetical protein